MKYLLLKVTDLRQLCVEVSISQTVLYLCFSMWNTVSGGVVAEVVMYQVCMWLVILGAGGTILIDKLLLKQA